MRPLAFLFGQNHSHTPCVLNWLAIGWRNINSLITGEYRRFSIYLYIFVKTLDIDFQTGNECTLRPCFVFLSIGCLDQPTFNIISCMCAEWNTIGIGVTFIS